MSEILSTKQVEAPAILKNRSLLGSDTALISKIESEAYRAVYAQQEELSRSFQEWSQYSGLDASQWALSDRIKMSLEDRTARQFNIIGPKVDTLVGSLQNEVFDFDWKPLEGERSTLTEAIKNTYYSDKELMNYEREIMGTVRDGCVNNGVIKMGVSTKFSPFGNISLKKVMPGFFVPDPYWVTDNDEDMEMCWEYFHLSALQIQQTYGLKNGRIRQEIEHWRRTGGEWRDKISQTHQQGSKDRLHQGYTSHDDYLPGNVGLDHRNQGGRKGHLFRVIEKHWMENVKLTRVIGLSVDQPEKPGRWVSFPITSETELLQKFMINNNVMPETMQEVDYTDRIHHVETVCPDLSKDVFLERGVSKVQIKRLPYFQFTSNRINGRNKGIVTDMIDVQEVINQREAKISDLIATAQGGGKLVNRELFANETDRRRFQEEANDPGYIGFVDGDEMTKERAIMHLQPNSYPSSVINQLERMWTIVDRVSKVSQSLESLTESNDSGVLFEKKLQASRIVLATITSNFKQFYNNIAEAYFFQWQITYNGVEREFRGTKGENHVVLNERVVRDGVEFIKNRPSEIARSSVIVTESDKSFNKQSRDRNVYGALIEKMAQVAPEYATFFMGKYLRTMDLSDEDKTELKKISELQKLRDIQKIQSDVRVLESTGDQADFAGMQAKMGMQQMMQPPEAVPEEQVQESLTEVP